MFEHSTPLLQRTAAQVLSAGSEDVEDDQLRRPTGSDGADPPTGCHPSLEPLEVQATGNRVPRDHLSVQDEVLGQSRGQDWREVREQGREVGAVAAIDA